MNVTHTWIRALAMMCVLFIASSCSFDSSLGNVTCSEEGVRDGDRVCRDGYWVAADDVTGDATDTPSDADPDVSPDVEDTGPDAPTCSEGEELCALECVDTSTSAEHCGGCGRACIAYGSNSVAECANGTCTRYCDAGFIDDNDDWLIENPAEDSDGCETTCTPTTPPTEVCDGEDNDCDGRVDNAENEWYRDADGDGYGADDSAVIQCDRPSSTYVEDGGDCNDSNADVNPGVVEECQGDSCTLCNGKDDNCNGLVDENCPCTGDETQSCFPFGSGSPDHGICEAGQQQCSDGTFGDCTGATGPESEACDGIDNDCDGTIDNGFPDKGDSCTVGTGACERTGNYVCTADGSGTTCDASPGASSPEACDGVDNDCDGSTDEDFGNKGDSCTVGTGVCENSGTFVCASDGSGTTCSASAGSPSSESCDGVDNDCDGDVDEDYSNKGDSCTVGTGACESTGTYECTANGSGTTCSASAGSPSSESCDGVDNDCDGDVDEDYSNKGDSCTVGTGACESTGTYECTANGSGTTCSATAGSPTQEVCGNQIDEDCDGQLDNGCPRAETTCDDGTDNDNDGDTDCDDQDCDTLACGTGSGATCSYSQTECIENECDGVDNDRDGAVDEGCDDDGDDYCDAGLTITTNDACTNTTAGDKSTYDCDDENSNTFPGATEECDGIDSDCDGTVDENDTNATSWCESNEGQSKECRNDSGSYCCRNPTGGSTC